MFLTLFLQNSKTNKTVTTRFRHRRHRTRFSHKTKAFKSGKTVHLDPTRLDLLMKASTYVHSSKLTAVSKSDLRIEELFDSIQDLTSKIDYLEGHLLCLFADWLILQNMLFVFIIVESRRWGFSYFNGFAEKAPAVGFLFKGKFENRLRRMCFFSWICEIFGSTCFVEQERVHLYCFGTTIIINNLS